MGIYDVQNVTWFKSGRPLWTAYDLAQLNATLSNDGKIIYLPSVSHFLHLGNYMCIVKLSNGYQIRNSNYQFELLIPCK